MSIEKSAERLKRLGCGVVFSGPQEERYVDALEAALQAKLPPSYREFLRSVGGGGTAGGLISGIFDGDPIGIYAGGVYSDTLRYREEFGLPDNLIVILAPDDSCAWCLDTAKPRVDGECPVVFYDCVQARVTKTLFGSFEEFFDSYVAVRISGDQGA
jgi:hypothetical protein